MLVTVLIAWNDVAGALDGAPGSPPSQTNGDVHGCPPGTEPVRPSGPTSRPTSCTHGEDHALAAVSRPRSLSALLGTTTSATSSVPCYGDGTSGSRVQAVYAVPADRPDRYATVEAGIRRWAAETDRVFADSAAQTGGVRHVRFVTDSACQLVVLKMALSARGDDSIQNTAAELAAAGFDRPDRKYLVWMDSTVMCGTAGYYVDDRPGAENVNNGGAPGQLARVDSGCWGLGANGSSVEAHELMHALGSVQPSAPHATPIGHCSDDADPMCYADGTVGQTMLQRCPVRPQPLFDCGQDDYFSTAPAAGSYLAGHWNTASSSFLAREPGGAPTAVPPPLVEVPRVEVPLVEESALTLVAPVTAVAGVPLRVAGRAAPGASVQIWGVTAPSATLTRVGVAAATADSGGAWAVTVRPLRNVTLQARVGELRSGTRYIAVSTALTQTVTALSGCVLQVAGRSFEPKPGAVVDVRARTAAGTKVDVGRVVVGSDGRFLLRRARPCSQSLSVYSVIAGDAVNRAGASAAASVLTRR
ncbi:MAG TPA: hypothetical protein VNA14_11180 [Mycobacteriales bacterium]|nr:hypothetical protein [Mycobacteriales bacterium]